jgi:hypothetical protein
MHRHTARRAFIYTFIITLCIVFTAMAFLIADRETGRDLHGNQYTPSLPGIHDGVATAWLPPRFQVFLQLPARLREWLQTVFQKEPPETNMFRAVCISRLPLPEWRRRWVRR